MWFFYFCPLNLLVEADETVVILLCIDLFPFHLKGWADSPHIQHCKTFKKLQASLHKPQHNNKRKGTNRATMRGYSRSLTAILFLASIQNGLSAAPCSLLTQSVFNTIAPAATFPYTYNGFCTAVTNWNANNPTNQIFMGATDTQQKADLAAFFGNILHESDKMKAAREYYMCQTQTTVNGKVYCKPSGYNGGSYNDPYCSVWHTPTSNPAGCACGPIPESTVAPGYIEANKLFMGRGGIQLSWNYNYFYAGAALNVDLCANPELVATDEQVMWGTTFYFWTSSTGSTGTTCKQFVEAGSFGGTVKTIVSVSFFNHVEV